MSELLFGTAGTPHSAESPSSVDGIKHVAELGLGCMELEFVRQAKMSEATAHLVAETAASTGIKLSAHAPYYINLNAREPDKVQASQYRLLQTARIASWCGATSVVFHTAFSIARLRNTSGKCWTSFKRKIFGYGSGRKLWVNTPSSAQ